MRDKERLSGVNRGTDTDTDTIMSFIFVGL